MPHDSDILVCPMPSSRGGAGSGGGIGPLLPRLPAFTPRMLLTAACAAAVLFGGMHAWDRSVAVRRESEAAAVRRLAKDPAVAALAREARAKPRLDAAVWRRLLPRHSPALRKSLAKAFVSEGAPPARAADDASALLPEVTAALAAAKGPARSPAMLSALAARKGREANALRVVLPLPWGAEAARRGVPPATVKSLLLISAMALGAAGLLPCAAMLLLGLVHLTRRAMAPPQADRQGATPRESPAPSPAAPAVWARWGRRGMVPEEQAARLAAERDRLQAQLAALLADLDGSTGEEDKLRAMRRRVAEAERRAEEAERRLRAAAAERDVAMQSLHRAAEAAAAAARVALGGPPQRKPLEGE